METNIRTFQDIFRFFDTLIQPGQDTGVVNRGTSSAIKAVLEDIDEENRENRKRITRLEDTLSETETLYRDMLFFLTEMVRQTDNRAVELSVKQLKSILDQDGKRPLIEKAFENLKDAVLSETKDNARQIDRSRLLGLMGKWLKSAGDRGPIEDRYMELYLQYKETYLSITDELKLVLSNLHRRTINTLEQRVTKAQDVKDFLSLRQKVLDLLQEFIAESNNDKAQAIYFAEEISRRILDMDQKMSGTFDHFQETQSLNKKFNDRLEAGIQELRETMTIRYPMKELTDTINKKIALISDTLYRKKEADNRSEKKLKARIEILKHGMKRVRDGFREAREKNRALENELNVDHLTGAASKRAYEHNATKEMQRFSRYHRIFSIITFDIDRFKLVNDNYGHDIGDKTLQEVAAGIQPMLRQTDILARTGGDEFVMILPETRDSDALMVAEKIRQKISKTEFLYKKDRITVTLSLGVAQVLDTDKNFEAVFKRADEALYRSKENGRNQATKYK